MMVLPIDLPYVDAQALANVAACAGDMVIASDERGSGTNILFMRDAAARTVPFAFGDGSFAAYRASARTLGLSSRVIRDWRLGFDIDEPAQYFQWRRYYKPVAEPMQAASSSTVMERIGGSLRRSDTWSGVASPAAQIIASGAARRGGAKAASIAASAVASSFNSAAARLSRNS